ncbi:serpin family protein [Natronolimnobius sp. AArcel1]|uniref:serpin family protein n=1 Tax=Natronolimnobius sp. AArcel1 TaxID=1679093 RepID=UPI0013EA622F|nr:serpin family protein [Natronolimnobius sp. AArcel1]NGM68380.1 serpin family protein [Natronolimnobius sp. AArcel1]
MPSQRRTVLALTGALLAGAAGCLSDNGNGDSDDDGESGNGTDADGSDDPANGSNGDDFPQVDPVTDPDIDTGALAQQVRGNIDFSLAVLEQLREDDPESNLFLSPYSISVALAMTYAGARGETAAEMADALRYNLESDDLHAAFGALEAEFERRNEDGAEVDEPYGMEGEASEDDLGFELSSANSVWAEADFPFDEDYVDLLEAYYGAGERLVDFSGSPDEAREEINAWVEEQTNDRIEELLPEGSVDSSTRLVLTNAVYFLAAWEHDFDPAETEPATFTGLDGSETELELMHQSEELEYAAMDGHQLVELPYANGETSMVVILPADGEFEAFEESLSTDQLGELLEETSRPQVDLALPKFGLESEFSLVETMDALGMERAFGSGADFSGMLEGDDGGLFISEIVHQSFIEVDEEGTEAAAATAVAMDESAPADHVEVTVDRPFLFYIRDLPTETPLFWGRVVDGETLQDE